MGKSWRCSVCALAFCTFSASACAQEAQQISQTLPAEVEPIKHDHVQSGSFIAILSEGHTNSWYKANFSYPSDFYNTGWVADNIRFSSDGLGLFIDRRETKHQPYSGAEYQKLGRYGLGRYEAVVKPAAGSGLVSSFFVYTGPHYNDPHHEVDIEFLGQDTTQMHPNIFVNGKPKNPPTINLGFDAAESFNLYAFEWDEERITWFVNDQKVLVAERPLQDMPRVPGLIMANLWTGSKGQYDWHGRPNFEDHSSTHYKCISYRAPGDEQAEQCSDRDFTD